MRLLTLITALAAALPLRAVEFKPALKADIRGQYENQQISAKAGWAKTANIFAVPALDFGGELTLAPVLAYIRESKGELVVEEDTRFVESNTFLAKPILRLGMQDGWARKAWGNAKRAVNKETHGETWSGGLYDWEEFGGGLGLERKGALGLGKLSVGLELLHRGYPNWHESGTSVSFGRNYYSKDFNGAKLSLDLTSPEKQALTWDSGLLWFGRGYTDNLLVKNDGTFDYSATRSDSLLRWDASVRYALSEGLGLRLTYKLDWNKSNQNIFDPVFNEPQADFYSYLSNGVSLAVDLKGPGELSWSASAGLTNRAYTGRSIRTPLGVYTDGKQADLEQRYSVGLSYPVWGGISLVGGADWLFANSNQGYEGKVRSTYDLFNANLGLVYKL